MVCADQAVVLSALYVSLIVATCTALLSVVFGLPAALALSRGRFSGRDALNAILLSPLSCRRWSPASRFISTR